MHYYHWLASGRARRGKPACFTTPPPRPGYVLYSPCAVIERSQVCRCKQHDNTCLCEFSSSPREVATRVTFSPRNRCYFVKIINAGCQQTPRSCSLMELYCVFAGVLQLSLCCVLTCRERNLPGCCQVQMFKDAPLSLRLRAAPRAGSHLRL